MEVTPEERAQGALTTENLERAVRTFREAGFVVLEGVYEPGFVAGLRDAYQRLIERYLADRGGIDALDGKTFGKNHIGIHPALTAPWSDARIVANPFADQVMSHLLGADYQCGYYHSNATYPGSDIQPMHRDSPALFSGEEMSVPHPVVNLVLNVPLVDFTLENGSTEVWPGTHLLVDRFGETRANAAERLASFPSVRTNVPAGSLVLRDLRLFHRGMPNRSDHVRPMLALVYVRGWRTTGELPIPRATWDAWPERARAIFRNNFVTDEAVEQPYRITESRQK